MIPDMSRKFFALWCSGFTRRWHTNPALSHHDDFIAAHQGRAAMLVIILWPDHTSSLLKAAVTHDAAEVIVGDLAAPFKKVGGDVVRDHAMIEADVRAAMGFCVGLTPRDRIRLKLVDVLDAYLFVALRHPAELGRNGWPEAREAIIDMAARAGGDAVNRVDAILADAEDGAQVW